MKYKTEYQFVKCHNDMLTKLHNKRHELWHKSPLIHITVKTFHEQKYRKLNPKFA